MSDGRMAVLIQEDNISFWDKENDCVVKVPALKKHVVIKDVRRDGSIQSGQILIIRPTTERVPNLEDGAVVHYWEICHD